MKSNNYKIIKRKKKFKNFLKTRGMELKTALRKGVTISNKENKLEGL